MARRRATQDVELTEEDPGPAASRGAPAADDAPTGGGSAPRRPSRRLLLGAAAAVVVVAAGLVVAQRAADDRAREDLARLGEVPGVLAPLEAPLRVVWTSDDLMVPMLAEGWHDTAAVVGVGRADDASTALVARSGSTGDVVWRVPLVDAPGDLGGGAYAVGSVCAALPRAGTDDVVCVAADAFAVTEGTSVYTTMPTTSRLLLVDGGTGAVLAEHADPDGEAPARDLTVSGGHAVLLGADAQGRSTLRAVDPTTGDEAWRTALPADDPSVLSGNVHTAAQDDVTCLRDGTVVVLRRSGDVLLVDPATGAVQREVPHADTPALSTTLRPTGAGPGVLSRTDGATTTVVLATGDVTFPGYHVPVVVDDDSAGDVVLARDGTRVRALDPGTGDARWSADAGVVRSAHVLDGRVHLESAAAVVTVDARTGAELWRYERPGSTPSDAPLVDGRLLWEQVPAVGQRHTVELLGLDPADGTERARVPLPPGVTQVQPYAGLLAAFDADGTTVLGPPRG